MAAGKSSRFSQAGAGHKLLARVQGKAIIEHSLQNACDTGMDVFVTTRPEDVNLHPLMKHVRSVTCASAGLGESIAAAVQASAHYDGWLISLADLPFLKAETFIAAARGLRTSPLVRMEVNGLCGHPVGFGRSFYSSLISLNGDSGPRELLGAFPLRRISTTDTGCIEDIDTVQDLARLRAGDRKQSTQEGQPDR